MVRNLLPLMLCITLVAAFAADQQPPKGEAVVEVRLRIVPFFAVGENGQPVTDLKPEEVEIRVDGKPVKLEYFDAYPFVVTESGAVTPAKEPTTPRQVHLLFDVAFSTPRGFRRSRELALDIVDRLYDRDRVYLWAYGAMSGLKPLWGPLSGHRRVKAALIRTLGLEQLVEKVLPAELEGLEPPADRKREEEEQARLGGEFDRAAATFQALAKEAQAFNRWTYAAAAERMAPALKAIADSLKFQPGPKILFFFSQGIHNDVYFGAQYAQTRERPTGEELATGGAFGQDDRMVTSFLHRNFEDALNELSDAGVMSVYINTEGGLNRSDAEKSGENALRHMARTSGGLYLAGTDLATVRRHVVSWTSAYYEASFRPRKLEAKGKRHKVEIRVRRPGVKIWSLKRLRDPKAYRYFSKHEKQLYALQLVTMGPERLRMRPVAATWHPMAGRVTRRRDGSKDRLVFTWKWPENWKNRRVEYFSIVFPIQAAGRLGPPRKVRHDTRTARGMSLRIEETVPAGQPCLWGIVAVDPDTGTTYWLRAPVPDRS